MENNKIDIKSFIIGILGAFIIFNLFGNQISKANSEGNYTLSVDNYGVYILNTYSGKTVYHSKNDCTHYCLGK